MKNRILIFISLLFAGSTSAQQPGVAPAPPLLPANEFAAISILSDGNYLGVSTQDVTRENMNQYRLRAARGVIVTNVAQGSPAERAGLRKDDVILSFDGEAVTNERKLNRLVNEAPSEHAAQLTISRSGAEQTISVTLGKRDNLLRGFNPALRLPKQLEELRGNRQLFRTPFEGTRRSIGVSVQTLTDQLADYFGVKDRRGVLVTSVVENGPAARGGVKAGDVIIEVDGNRIERVGDLTRALNLKEGGEVTMVIIRDKNQRTIRVTPERGRAFPFNFTPGIQTATPMARGEL